MTRPELRALAVLRQARNAAWAAYWSAHGRAGHAVAGRVLELADAALEAAWPARVDGDGSRGE